MRGAMIAWVAYITQQVGFSTSELNFVADEVSIGDFRLYIF